MTEYYPEIIQVVPHEDYTVSVYFSDGKTVIYDVKPKLDNGIFKQLKDLSVFLDQCTIMNDTLAWDIAGNRDESKCIDIDPYVLYQLSAMNDKTT